MNVLAARRPAVPVRGISAVGALLLALLAWGASPVAAASANDDFVYAQVLSGMTGTVRTAPASATYEAGERRSEGTFLTGSVWYRVVAPVDGTLAVTNTGTRTLAFSISSGPDVAHQTYPPGSTFAVCDCSPPNWGTAHDAVVRGGTYAISVEVFEQAGSQSSEVAFQWSFTPPANDGVYQAQVLGGSSARVTGSTARALADPIYDFSAGAVQPLFGSHDVWFRWTAPGPGTLTVSTAGSSFDTSVTVGRLVPGRVNSVSLLAANDNDGASRQSRVQLDVDTGDPLMSPDVNDYLIALSGPALSSGAYALAYGFTPRTWTEITDAGGVAHVAQVPIGEGELRALDGTLRESNDDDMFRICTTGTTPFSARATGTPDLQLFLMDADGRAVAANDDESTSSRAASLPAGHALLPTTAGMYHLAVSAWDNEPANNAGGIFRNLKVGVNGPRVPGADPVLRWNSQGRGSTGRYHVALTGARYCPA